jgi:hypothetical protein
MRLRRLREPRYLIGAIVGVAYLYFSLFSRFRGGRSTAERNAVARARRRNAPNLSPIPEFLQSAPAITGIGLLAITAISWLVPFDSGLLDFSEAEVQFLFPAPVSRRELLLHRMLRSQLGILFAVVVFGITVPSLSGVERLWLGVALWVLFVTGKLYFTGVSLTRARMRVTAARERLLAWLPPAVALTAAALVAAALTRAFFASPPSGMSGAFALVGDVAGQPLLRIVLWPFIALTRPVFATSIGAYLAGLAGSVAVLAAVVAWVLKSDEAFHDAADEAARRRGRQAQGRQAVSYRARTTTG